MFLVGLYRPGYKDEDNHSLDTYNSKKGVGKTYFARDKKLDVTERDTAETLLDEDNYTILRKEMI